MICLGEMNATNLIIFTEDGLYHVIFSLSLATISSFTVLCRARCGHFGNYIRKLFLDESIDK